MIGPLFAIFPAGVYFFSARYLNIRKPRRTLYLLWRMEWHFMELASMLTELAGDVTSRLARFHVIQHVLANEIYYFLRLFHQTGCFLYLGSPLHIISSLLCKFYLFQNAILHKKLKLGLFIFWINFLCSFHWLQHFLF